MGQAQSCCCKRSQGGNENDVSQNYSMSFDVLGNQYVTFRSDQDESFLLRSMIFYSKYLIPRAAEACDNLLLPGQVTGYETFPTTRGSAWKGSIPRLCTCNFKEDRRGDENLSCRFFSSASDLQTTWKIVVSHELRALIYKCVRTDQYCIRLFSPPYPSEDYGQLILEEVVPDVILEGDYHNMNIRPFPPFAQPPSLTFLQFKGLKYAFVGAGKRCKTTLVCDFANKIAANVDVALVLLTCICVDAMEREPDFEQDSVRALCLSLVELIARLQDDKTKTSVGKKVDGYHEPTCSCHFASHQRCRSSVESNERLRRKSSVPSLWDKGHTPRVIKER
eukprot:292574-Hanusia_phi.AAC.11